MTFLRLAIIFVLLIFKRHWVVLNLRSSDFFAPIARELTKRYTQAFKNVKEVRTPGERVGSNGAFHIYPIRVPANKRDELFAYLKTQGILPQINYMPVHMLSAYRKKLGTKWGDFPQAEQYFEETLSLPLFVGLTNKQQDKVIRSVKDFFTHA